MWVWLWEGRRAAGGVRTSWVVKNIMYMAEGSRSPRRSQAAMRCGARCRADLEIGVVVGHSVPDAAQVIGAVDEDVGDAALLGLLGRQEAANAASDDHQVGRGGGDLVLPHAGH